MKFYVLLLNAAFALMVLGIAPPARRAKKIDKLRRGLPDRAPRLSPRVIEATKQLQLRIPGSGPLFANGGFEDAVFSPETVTFVSTGFEGVDVRSDPTLARSGHYYALLGPTVSQSVNLQLTNLDPARDYNVDLWHALENLTGDADSCSIDIYVDGDQIANVPIPADAVRGRTAYNPISTFFAPKTSAVTLSISGICAGWKDNHAIGLLIDDISVVPDV